VEPGVGLRVDHLWVRERERERVRESQRERESEREREYQYTILDRPWRVPDVVPAQIEISLLLDE
jgi:hypothetical protein